MAVCGAKPRLVDDVVTEIKAGLELWPSLVEICFFEKNHHGLPRRSWPMRGCTDTT